MRRLTPVLMAALVFGAMRAEASPDVFGNASGVAPVAPV